MAVDQKGAPPTTANLAAPTPAQGPAHPPAMLPGGPGPHASQHELFQAIAAAEAAGIDHPIPETGGYKDPATIWELHAQLEAARGTGASQAAVTVQSSPTQQVAPTSPADSQPTISSQLQGLDR
eukprot:7468364-Pyramimonas_sp.AAC.1